MWRNYKSTPISKIKEMAQDNKVKLSKKQEINPIEIEGRKIAKNWWGLAWCEYLIKYADYDNRVARGRSYVGNGFILDFKVKDNVIEALVQGSRKKPYEVIIEFDKCNKKTINKLNKEFSNHLESVEDLLSGNFPEELGNDFLESELFPKPDKEISFSCTCPDHAYLCKHISAALYAIGVKLDKNPEVLFILRGIEVEALIKKRLEKDVKDIINIENNNKDNVLSDDEAADLFDL